MRRILRKPRYALCRPVEWILIQCFIQVQPHCVNGKLAIDDGKFELDQTGQASVDSPDANSNPLAGEENAQEESVSTNPLSEGLNANRVEGHVHAESVHELQQPINEENALFALATEQPSSVNEREEEGKNAMKGGYMLAGEITF